MSVVNYTKIYIFVDANDGTVVAIRFSVDFFFKFIANIVLGIKINSFYFWPFGLLLFRLLDFTTQAVFQQKMAAAVDDVTFLKICIFRYFV